jgi:predicted TIM-barrel fold metal-dependent hydrolase
VPDHFDGSDRSESRIQPGRSSAQNGIAAHVEALPLVDHHCHGVVRRELSAAEFGTLMSEGHGPDPADGGLTSGFYDSQLGFALRRWCPPVLDLPAHATVADYLGRRAELGPDEVNRRFLRAAGLDALCVDTGYVPEPVLSPVEMAALAGARAGGHEVVRLERVAERVAAGGAGAAGFAGAVRAELAERARTAVAFKSIAAYRVGLALSPDRPDDTEVTAAADRWLRKAGEGAPPRLADEILHRFLVWCAADYRLPIQFHVGYGDADTDLRLGDPLLLTRLLRALEPVGAPVMLLHNYPFHRAAGYLAQVFPHVFVDVGLAVHNVGHRAPVLIAETLELTPYRKFLYSSDAFGLPELYYLGAVLFRRGLADYLADALRRDAMTGDDARRVADLVAFANANRVYRIGDTGEPASVSAVS